MISAHAKPVNRTPGASTEPDPRSFSQVLADMRNDAMELVRQEFRLFRLESKENAVNLLRHGAMLAVGGLVALMAANLLLLAISVGVVLLLTLMMPTPAALVVGPLLVALAFGLTGWALMRRGVFCLKRVKLWPKRAVAALRSPNNG